ncbi:GNAT family N-acetyltransferase [Deinococcus sp. YIM 134068]|uniref:GNAT family N-acetyltransferase n=1 Tax=Deinococcus lichenicola TaxID=3118910 RepID=UPI002F94C2E1
MFKLETARLVLVATSLQVIETRLERETFTMPIEVGPETWDVTFPAEWPGDSLDLFPMLAEQLRTAPETVPWGGLLIGKADRAVVGGIGCKSLPDASGTVEIGYGLNPSAWGRGLATEAAHALTDWALTQPNVRRVTAERLDTNIGPVRVLEKSGFRRVGERHDEEEGGLLILWERTR